MAVETGGVSADATSGSTEAYRRFRQARDLLLEHREDYAKADAEFAWTTFA